MGRLFEKIKESSGHVFIRSNNESLSYDQVAEQIVTWLERLAAMAIKPGEVVSLVGRFSSDSMPLFLALLENGNIVVPLDDESQENIDSRNEVARASHCLRRVSVNQFIHEKTGPFPKHDLIEQLTNTQEAGIILFTSGSTGESKAALHSMHRMLSKYPDEYKKKPFNIGVFLKFDHIGGLNTMLSVLMHGGCMTEVVERTPTDVCRLIQSEKIEVLPTTPSFLTMLIMSKVWEQFDLSSLKAITYGTEPMPESTLKRLFEIFPGVKIKQTYGLTELGIFPTRSREDQSTYLQIQESGLKTKVVDDVLYVQSDMMMLGYLNAPSPFDENGWYNTGDKVQIDGTYTKILGRESEIINVGGEKVFPAEVECVLLEMSNVKEVAVEAKSSPLVGQIVAAQFQLNNKENISEFRKRMVEHCKGKLEPFKVPRHIVLSDSSLMSTRLKKSRRNISIA